MSHKAASRVADERQRAHALMLAFEGLVLELESTLPAIADALEGVEHISAHGALERLQAKLKKLEEL